MVVASLAVPACVLGAQVRELGQSPSIRWVSTDAVDPGVVRGLVSNVDTGEPIGGAQVIIAGSVYGVLTDSTGRFEMATEYLDAEIQLRVEMIGYHPLSETLRTREGMGTVLQAGLEESSNPNCGLMICGGGGCLGGVRVLIRDVVTGGPPNHPVQLVVQSGELADSVSAVRGEDEEFFWLAAGEDLGVVGPFDVEVYAQGYETWRRSGVLILPHRCRPRGSSPPQYVWLLPASQ